MKIDNPIGPSMRRTIHAAVVRDFAMLEERLQQFPDDRAQRRR